MVRRTKNLGLLVTTFSIMTAEDGNNLRLLSNELEFIAELYGET